MRSAVFLAVKCVVPPGFQRSDVCCALEGASARHPSWTCARAGGNLAAMAWIFEKIFQTRTRHGLEIQRFPQIRDSVLDTIDIGNPA